MSKKKTQTAKSKKSTTKTATTKKVATKTAARTKVVAPKATAKTAKAKDTSKPKRGSALDAAAQVLKKAGQPMRAKDLITAMADQGLWKSPGGKTPHATLYAAMLREINAKGGDARFTKDGGLFSFNG